MPNDVKVITGAIAIIKDANGTVIGKMKDIRINETFRRVEVPKGIGSIYDDELALVKWSGSVSCSLMEISYVRSGIKGAIRRNFGPNIVSAIASGDPTANFEDQAVLDDIGVELNLYKKIKDIIGADGIIIPGVKPYALIKRVFIESDNVSISEGNVGGRDQQFRYLTPVITDADFETNELT